MKKFYELSGEYQCYHSDPGAPSGQMVSIYDGWECFEELAINTPFNGFELVSCMRL